MKKLLILPFFFLANSSIADISHAPNYYNVKLFVEGGHKIHNIVTDLQKCTTTSDADDQKFALVDDIRLATFTPKQVVIKKNGEIVTSLVNQIKYFDEDHGDTDLRQHIKFTINPDNKVTVDVSFIQRASVNQTHVVFVCDLGSSAKIYYER